ncbi:hypothetical protein [Mariniradius saccharolyticus]|nr:hypothetical protein [Mariniradius saccharolyticus]
METIITLAKRKSLNERAIAKGLFADLEKPFKLIIASNDPSDIFRTVHLKNDKVVLELIIEDPKLGDQIRTQEMGKESFWAALAVDPMEHIASNREVWFEFTGGFPEGDYELEREGYVIGNKYKGILHPEAAGGAGQVWTVAASGNDCVFYVGENCKVL